MTGHAYTEFKNRNLGFQCARLPLAFETWQGPIYRALRTSRTARGSAARGSPRLAGPGSAVPARQRGRRRRRIGGVTLGSRPRGGPPSGRRVPNVQIPPN